jgi:DNA-binding GntR family transcriptional regulator
VSTTPGWAAGLEHDRLAQARSSTAEWVAGILRDRIIQGSIAPGDRLPEEELRSRLRVSRNTLREAFRLLSHERLLVHELNRGVFVRKLDLDEVVDLYRTRRLIECAVLRTAGSAPPEALRRLEEAVEEGERAALEERWRDVGTANMRFHRAMTSLAGSRRIDEMMTQLLAELRLVFHVMKNPRAFHEPYLTRNREILKLLAAGDIEHAEEALHAYLNDAEQQLLTTYRQLAADGGDGTP